MREINLQDDILTADLLNNLECCPNCKYTKREYSENQLKWGGMNNDWGNYKPFIYKDRLVNEYVAECQNCGMSVIFPGEPLEIVIERWNKISRAILGEIE